MRAIERIFANKPEQFGFRGDPFLWDDLRRKLSKLDSEPSIDQFSALLKSSFKEILNSKGEERGKDAYFISEYPNTGMSGRGISLSWWTEKGLPLLTARYVKLVGK